MADKTETKICVFCGRDAGRFGNNPAPVKTQGVCCDACNMTIVIPARLRACVTKRT
jgi:hypothetical protein